MCSSYNSIFITVGTTEFKELIDFISNPDFVNLLNEFECKKLTVQVGNYKLKNFNYKIFKKNNITLNLFNYKNNLFEEIFSSDLIISHAGAGTCLEGLRAGKKMLVVINQNLMNNHQFELANKLTEENYLKCCTTDNLISTLEEFKKIEFKKFPKQNKNLLYNFIDNNIFNC